MIEFRHHQYTWTKPFGSERHRWELLGPHGGIHFHVSISEKYDDSCGLEFHHDEPVGPFKHSAAHHKDCPLIGGNCWHDGTSLYASEHIWPIVKLYLHHNDHEAIFKMLEREFIVHFSRLYPDLLTANEPEDVA